MTDRPGLDFSFSGLKTQVLLAWQRSDQRRPDPRRHRARLRGRGGRHAGDQVRARAATQTGARTLVVAGGVGANRRLRAQLQQMAASVGGRASAFPRPAFCTDNGAMIAFAGALRLQAGQRDDAAVTVTPRWDMASLPPVDATAARRKPRPPSVSPESPWTTFSSKACEIETRRSASTTGRRKIRQPIALDIEMAFDNRMPAASDDIEDTLDYKAVSKRLIAVRRRVATSDWWKPWPNAAPRSC